MTRLTLTTILSTALMALTISQVAVASPHHARPVYHRPPVHHAPPPKPAYHHAPRHHHNYVYHDVAGALVAGAVILGAANLIGNAVTSTTRSLPPASYTPNTTPVTPQTMRFWCESEKGFYPDVRACPLGWTPIPAN